MYTGIAALGLIAQAIEPMAGAHRDQLTDLRRRMGWGTNFASEPAETWHDVRPPAEVVEERIIGENTLRPLYRGYTTSWSFKRQDPSHRTR